MDDLKRQLEKLDERVDRIDVAVARVDERLIYLQKTLEAHDAKGAKALVEAMAAHKRIDNVESYVKIPVQVALWVRNIGLGVAAIYALYIWLRSQ